MVLSVLTVGFSYDSFEEAIFTIILHVPTSSDSVLSYF